MSKRINTMIPLRWWWSDKRLDRWIAGNNTYDPEGVDGLVWRSKRYGEASDYYGRLADRVMVAALIFGSISVAMTIISLILWVVAS